MNDRERILGYAVGGIVALILLFGAYRVVKSGFDAKKTTLGERLQTLRQETQINKQSKRDRALVGEFQRKSLSENTEQAHLQFQHWLEKQVKEVGLSKHRITFDGMPRTKKTIKELSYLVSGEGDVKQVKDFLYRVHSADTLHRIRTIDLQKSKNTIKMSARIDAVTMPKIQGEKVAIGKVNDAKLALPLDDYDQIVMRNMFSPGNEAPRFKSLRTKTVSIGERLNVRLEATDPNDDELTFKLDSDAPDWLDISKSGRLSGKPEKEGRHTFKVFCVDQGIPSKETVGELTIKVTPKKVEEKPEEEEFDESKLAVLTAIVQGRLDPLPQMCMYMRSKDESQYLQEGDRLKVGKWKGEVILVDPDTNTVLLQNEDGEFELRLGDALSDARPIKKKKRDDAAE